MSMMLVSGAGRISRMKSSNIASRARRNMAMAVELETPSR
jgi:hypothetical protein